MFIFNFSKEKIYWGGLLYANILYDCGRGGSKIRKRRSKGNNFLLFFLFHKVGITCPKPPFQLFSCDKKKIVEAGFLNNFRRNYGFSSTPEVRYFNYFLWPWLQFPVIKFTSSDSSSSSETLSLLGPVKAVALIPFSDSRYFNY